MGPEPGAGRDRSRGSTWHSRWHAHGLLVETSVTGAALQGFQMGCQHPPSSRREAARVLLGVDPASSAADDRRRKSFATGHRFRRWCTRHAAETGSLENGAIVSIPASALSALAGSASRSSNWMLSSSGDASRPRGSTRREGHDPTVLPAGEVVERGVGEVGRGFIGGEVQVGEDDDAGGRMLQDLRAPAGVISRVKALAKLKAEALKQADDPGKIAPGATERVVIVVRPSQASSAGPGRAF